MAPKEPYKVHSLSKHVENTKKGLAAVAQASRRPAGRSAAIKKESNPNNIFANNSDDDDEGSGSGSDSDSSDDAPVSFMDRLVASDAAKSTPAKATPVKSTQASRRRSKDDEIADSDDERNASKKASVEKPSPESESSSSDSESGEDTNTKTNGAPIKAVESDSSSSESGSESDSEEEDAKDAPAAKASTEKKDDSESSSDEEESEDEVDSKPKPAVNGTAATTTSTSSSESSEDESESESEEEQVAKPATKTAKTAAKPVAPEPESSSSEDEDSDEEMVDESMHIEDREGQVAVPTFMAPDFVLRKGDDGTNGKDVAEVCNKANLEGKQFWYFTVPSNIPISVVQNLEIPMNQSSAGNKLFSHDGEDYGFSFESIAPRGNIQIMIPSADASQYRSAPKQVDQMMQVKKITQLGSDTSVGPAPKPAPRAQPAGLRARYQPIGVNEPMASASDGEDVEMAEAPATSTKASKKEKKRKESSEKKHKKSLTLPERPSSQTVEAPTPDTRKNKRKLAASEDDATAVAEQLQQEAKSAVKKSKKQKTDRVGSPELGSESVATKKQTPVLPPSFPAAGTSTPKPAATPATTSKKQKKVKETPVPAPRMSAVPIPSIPHSSPPKSSPAPPTSPIQAKEKRSRKSKDSKKTSSARKETPVLPPMPGSSSE